MAASYLDLKKKSEEADDSDDSDTEADASTDLPEDTDTSEEDKSSSPAAVYQPKTKAGPSYVLVPLNAPKLDTKTDEQVTGSALDLTNPNQLGATKAAPSPAPSATQPVDTDSPEGPTNIQTDPETGTRYVDDSGVQVPHAELATPADLAAFKPGDVTLPKATVQGQAAASVETPDLSTDLPEDVSPVVGGTAQPTQPEVRTGWQAGVTPKAQPADTGAIAEDQGPPGTPPKVQPAQPVTSPEAAPVTPAPRQTSLGLTPDEYKAQYVNPPTGTAAQPSVATADAGGLNINTDYTADSNSSAKGRGGDGQIHGIILHSSDGRESGDINQLTHGGVSAHYYVTTDGRIYNLVPEGDTAYHAGQTRGQYANYNNSNTIGIEQEHYDPGGKGGANGEAWSPAQVAATAKLVGYLKGKYGLSDNDIMGHSDIAPERKQDPYNYPWKGFFKAVDSSSGAAQPTGAAGGKAQAAGVGPAITGKATTFGYNDPEDNGVGAPKLGQLDTNNKDLVGIAVPEEALRAYVGAHPQSWRTSRVQVTTKDGKSVLVPIVDLGPRDTSGNVVADFTQGLTDLTGNKGDQNFGFRIIPNAGPDVMKDPQAFADEQAAIKAGINTGARFQAPAAKKPSYVLQPMAPKSPQQEQANQFERQGQIDNLSILSESTSNPVALYRRLDSDVEGVTPAMRQQFQANLKPQVISLMKQSDPSLNDDQAWAKAQTDPNVLDVGVDFWNKFVGSFQQLQPLLQQATGPSVEQSHLDSFLSQALPNGSAADKEKLLTDLYKLPPDQRGAKVQSLIPNPQVGVPGQDPQQVVSALDRLNDPNYLKTQADQAAKAQADLKQRMTTDPRLAGSPAAFASENLAQIPEMLAAAAIPPLMAAQVSQQVRDQMREQHPEYSHDELDQKAAYSTLVQFVGQEAASKLFTAGAGALIQGVKSPVQRAIAQALIQTGSGAAIMGGAQAGSNLVTGEPIGQGVPAALASGAIMGGVTGAVHGAGELRQPAETTEVLAAVSPPEAVPKVNQAAPLGEETTTAPPPTTGPAGGTIHGATAETMASGGEETPRETNVPPAPTAPVAEESASQEPAQPSAVPVDQTGQVQQPTVEEKPQQSVTQEAVSRRAYELYDERTKSGQPGTAADDWAQAQKELSQADEPPPATVSEAEPINSAIANRYVQERIATGELGQIDPSQGKSTEDMVQQGLQMSRDQREGLIKNFMKGQGGDLDQQGAAIRAREAILSEQARAASRAADTDPDNPNLQAQAKAASNAVTAFYNGPIKKFKQVWSDAGRVLQREIPLDFTTLNGMKEAYLKGRGNGNEASPEVEPKLKRMADAVNKIANRERTAMNNWGKEIGDQTRGKPLVDDNQIRAKLMEIMKDLPCRT